jgi:hypothetical protein
MALIRSGKTSAIVKGIERAETAGYTKTYDVAIAIQVELDKAGLKIVRKPRKDGMIDLNDEAITAKALETGSFNAAFE